MSDIEGGLGAQVDYQERFSAAGRIPHNAQRRELAPSSTEIGRAQSVQCALEPLFAKGFAGRCQASPASEFSMPFASCCRQTNAGYRWLPQDASLMCNELKGPGMCEEYFLNVRIRTEGQGEAQVIKLCRTRDVLQSVCPRLDTSRL